MESHPFDSAQGRLLTKNVRDGVPSGILGFEEVESEKQRQRTGVSALHEP